MTATRQGSTTALHSPLRTTLSRQALSLGLAAVVTAVVLAGLRGLAGSDHAAVLTQQVQQVQQAPQAIATVLASVLA